MLCIFLLTARCAAGQDHTIEGVSPDLHLLHSVAAKETWYSIGRLYNLPAKDIAVYNKMSINKPLDIGQRLQIPLTTVNFSQTDARGSGETFIPVYHVVQPKEWLYRISVNYNKVPVENLQKWNSIGKDGAKPGTRLIVGYLKVKDGNAALAGAPHEDAAPKAVLPPARKTEDTPVATPQKATQPPAAKVPDPATPHQQGSNREGSYFKSLFEDNGRSASGIAGIFKSTSGWNDGKYYALVNNVPVGTIIKVTYPSTNKAIYAKVLGELPDMKESEGLALRISDAAASELGSADSKFSVSFRY